MFKDLCCRYPKDPSVCTDESSQVMDETSLQAEDEPCRLMAEFDAFRMVGAEARREEAGNVNMFVVAAWRF